MESSGATHAADVSVASGSQASDGSGRRGVRRESSGATHAADVSVASGSQASEGSRWCGSSRRNAALGSASAHKHTASCVAQNAP